jgi:hypothetical protein
LDVAVLTCLNLAREILTAREHRSSEAGDEGRVRTLIERVEAVLDRESQNLRRSASDVEAGAPSGVQPVARTLELSSVEEFRDRRSSAPMEGSGDEDLNAHARAAAGGRDRVG